ncbi:hypothetical protein RvY_18740 [Ramazzottius varieornatus]|uniref:Uncharacterized protein n=1 Tax=Ramazzottius varieornatus TaxID=947166 RepID=A0A1D1W752_RAMVA|nr:hypothetical protein RvY_18740 [Ramazzottius varieornatus]
MYNIPEDQKIVVQQIVLIGLCVHREDAEEEIASFKRVAQGLAPTRRKPNSFYGIRLDKEKNELLPRPKQRTEGYFHLQEHEITVPAVIYDLAELFHVIGSQIPPLEPVTLGEDFKDIKNHKHTPSAGTKAFAFSYHTSERKARVHFPSLRVRLKFPPASTRLQEMLGFQNQSIVSAADSPAFHFMEDRLKNYADTSTTHQTPRFWPREDEPLTEADRSVWYLVNRYPNEFKLSVLELPYLVISKRCINLYLGDQSLFIYCDVAAYTHVGHSYEKLSRIRTGQV